MNDRPALTPGALRDAPALIESVFPAQKVSFEAQKERKSQASQTLTALGSFWKVATTRSGLPPVLPFAYPGGKPTGALRLTESVWFALTTTKTMIPITTITAIMPAMGPTFSLKFTLVFLFPCLRMTETALPLRTDGIGLR